MNSLRKGINDFQDASKNSPENVFLLKQQKLVATSNNKPSKNNNLKISLNDITNNSNFLKEIVNTRFKDSGKNTFAESKSLLYKNLTQKVNNFKDIQTTVELPPTSEFYKKK